MKVAPAAKHLFSLGLVVFMTIIGKATVQAESQILTADGIEQIPSGCMPSANGTQFADVTGDGKADAIVINQGGVTVRRSNGSQFLPNESWTATQYYGSIGTYFADATGDGKADAIVVNQGGVTVRRSDGSQFLPNESWTATQYYGSIGTYFADATGDGKADAIVVNQGGVTVRRSDGSQFLPNESWTESVYLGDYHPICLS